MEISARDEYKLCFGCGQGNPLGLKLSFRLEDGKAKAEFIPGPYHQSWNGVFHGGLLAVCLDETFGYTLYFQGVKGLTARMEMRIRQTIRTGQKIFLTGEIKKQNRRLIEAYAKAELADGTLVAEATGKMFIPEKDFAAPL